MPETIVDITPKMIRLAAKELIVEDARDRIRDYCGNTTMRRAEQAAEAMLRAALEIDLNA